MTTLTITSNHFASLARRHTRVALGGSVLCCIIVAELATALIIHTAI